MTLEPVCTYRYGSKFIPFHIMFLFSSVISGESLFLLLDYRASGQGEHSAGGFH